jgi:hypothetical protein
VLVRVAVVAPLPPLPVERGECVAGREVRVGAVREVRVGVEPRPLQAVRPVLRSPADGMVEVVRPAVVLLGAEEPRDEP